MDLTLRWTHYYYGDFGGGEDLLRLPIHRLPKLKYLTIDSDVSVGAPISDPVADVTVPALRRITLISTPDPTIIWLVEIAKRLKEQGNWDSFECLNDESPVSKYEELKRPWSKERLEEAVPERLLHYFDIIILELDPDSDLQ